jgi:hypothetical protein
VGKPPAITILARNELTIPHRSQIPDVPIDMINPV